MDFSQDVCPRCGKAGKVWMIATTAEENMACDNCDQRFPGSEIQRVEEAVEKVVAGFVMYPNTVYVCLTHGGKQYGLNFRASLDELSTEAMLNLLLRIAREAGKASIAPKPESTE